MIEALGCTLAGVVVAGLWLDFALALLLRKR